MNSEIYSRRPREFAKSSPKFNESLALLVSKEPQEIAHNLEHLEAYAQVDTILQSRGKEGKTVDMKILIALKTVNSERKKP